MPFVRDEQLADIQAALTPYETSYNNYSGPWQGSWQGSWHGSSHLHTQSYYECDSTIALPYGYHGIADATFVLSSSISQVPATNRNVRLPKTGDVVRDTHGRIVGTWRADGTVEPCAPEVTEAIETYERGGVPLDSATARRAIDLSGQLKR